MLYKYTIADVYRYDPTIFDNVTLPDAFDKETFINVICRDCGQFSLIRRYGDVPYLKLQLKYWSNEYSKKWEKLAEIYELEYNVGWNVDGSVKEIYSGESTGNSSTVNKVTTYEDDTLRDKFSDTGDSAGTQDYVKETIRGGNIGVTTTGQLIQDSFETWNGINAYKEIAKDFARTFCIRIY